MSLPRSRGDRGGVGGLGDECCHSNPQTESLFIRVSDRQLPSSQ
jgi:hypothetical protein